MTDGGGRKVTVNEQNLLAERFEQSRARLRAVAYRMLGSQSEAEDAVQEGWLRLSRSGAAGVGNLEGWLTTVVARVCLDMLRSRRTRREEPLDAADTGPAAAAAETGDPEHEALLADSVGLALLIVLDSLPPAERVAFVLHDMFDVPFGEIAPIVGRSPDAAKMMASRARRRVRGAGTVPDTDLGRQRDIVGAFLAASRGGDFGALLAMLDPEVVLRADQAGVRMGAAAEVRGAAAVAETFAGRARAARLALVDGVAAVVWAQGGTVRAVFTFTVTGGKITEIGLLAGPERLSRFDVAYLRN